MSAIVTISSSPEVLRSTADPVPVAEITSKKITHIIQQMTAVLQKTTDGIGIAAPQIGVPLRIYIASEEALLETPDEEKKKTEWKYFVFINPEIIKQSKEKQVGSEGCLSVPKTYGTVTRAEKVRVRAYDEKGRKFERGASKLFARLMQHEIDHLNGVLFIDKATELHTIS